MSACPARAHSRGRTGSAGIPRGSCGGRGVPGRSAGRKIGQRCLETGTEAKASVSSRPPPPPPPSLKLPAGQRVRSWPWAELPAGIAPRHPRPVPSRPAPAAAAGPRTGERPGTAVGAGAAPQASPRTPTRFRGRLRSTVPRRSLLRWAPLPPRLSREKVRSGWKVRCRLHPAPGSSGMLMGTGAGS